MVATEIIAGLQGFNAMLNGAKALKDMNDAAVRNAAVIELQNQIIAAQAQQTTLIARVSELEEEVRSFETWDAEKQRYELKQVGDGATAYMLKPETRGSEPPHWVCPNCYEQRKKGIFQPIGEINMRYKFKCGRCDSTISTRTFRPAWVEE